MADLVLDASALLAWIDDEPGAHEVGAALDAGPVAMSAVNWAEVLAKLVDRGIPEAEQRQVRGSLDLDIRPFDEAAAFACAALRAPTRRKGLSTGDCACLALALSEGLPALTADKVWSSVPVGASVRVIR